jgi:hypothetical protein
MSLRRRHFSVGRSKTKADCRASSRLMAIRRHIGQRAGIGLMTPDQVHFGQAEQVYDARQKILDHAFEANPERFVRMPPRPPRKPTAAWINPPSQREEIQA